MCPEIGQSAHECSTLRPSFPSEKTMSVKDLSNQLWGQQRRVMEPGLGEGTRGFSGAEGGCENQLKGSSAAPGSSAGSQVTGRS